MLLLIGAAIGLGALVFLTAAHCEPSPNGPLPWPTPTMPAEPQEPFEEMSGWTWQQLEDYVGEIGGGMAGAGQGGAFPAEGDVLGNGLKVVCSNPETGVYIVAIESLPPPPAPDLIQPSLSEVDANALVC